MVYNPGALYEDGQYHLFFRALGQAWVSKIGHSTSRDGENFKVREPKALLRPEGWSEKNGVEDPRVSKIGCTFYLTYTAYDGECARLYWASSLDLKSWKHRGDMLPYWDAKAARGFTVAWDDAQHNSEAKKHWHKAGGIFPELIDGKLQMIFGDRHLWWAKSKDGQTWTADLQPWLSKREGFFDSVHVEMGPPPLKTDSGWLVLYHGVDEKMVYRLGYLLLDKKNPQQIIKRSNKPIFEATASYEISGLVDILPGGLSAMAQMEAEELNKFIDRAKNKHKMPRVIFCNGAVLRDDVLRIYYGAGDSVICTATARLKDLLKAD
jgi:predicted GH43/DUF377 family glycosyl hydrolase